MDIGFYVALTVGAIIGLCISLKPWAILRKRPYNHRRVSMGKQKTEIRWTLLWVMLIGMSLIGVLSFIYTKEYVALIGAASSLLGGIGAVIKQLISPNKVPPDPNLDEGRLTPQGFQRIFIAIFGNNETLTKPAEQEPMKPPVLRTNLLLVLIFGSIFVVILSQVFPASAAVAVIALANALLGYGIGSMIDLVTPSVPEKDPAVDEGMVTPSGVERIAKTGRDIIGVGHRTGRESGDEGYQ